MAFNKFEYPVTSPTYTLTFTHGHLINDGMGLSFNENTGLSIGGTRMTESFGNAKYVYDFSAIIPNSSDTETDVADVLAFFIAVNGASGTFLWTDESGIARSVKMTAGTFRIDNFNGINKQFAISLEVQ